MQRRTFLRDTSLSVFAISVCGSIRFNGHHFVGDCETTSDILGPFYRPDSPVRNNLVISGQPGKPIELTGIITHNDCITPFKNAKVEIWHCDGNGVYDNSSAEFRYRGTTFSNEMGQYSFKTILPIPYEIGDGSTRPAHFHMMITAEGYQPLVTQLYFSGDKHISKDMFASSPAAKNRILEIKSLKDGSKKVIYNVGLSTRLDAESAAIDKLVGIYIDEKEPGKKIEFFKKNNRLWMKNEVFGENFEYKGNNTFEYPGLPKDMYAILHFEILPSGSTKVTYSTVDEKLTKHIYVAIKK